jgi:hypothetical protein
VDKDCVLDWAFSGSNTTVVVGNDPNIAATDVSAPTTRNYFTCFRAESQSWHACGQFDLKIPLAAGEVVYVAFAAAGLVQLKLSDPEVT